MYFLRHSRVVFFLLCPDGIRDDHDGIVATELSDSFSSLILRLSHPPIAFNRKYIIHNIRKAHIAIALPGGRGSGHDKQLEERKQEEPCQQMVRNSK